MPKIEIHENTVTFESPQQIPMGNALHLSMTSDQKLQVEVELCRPLENGNFLVKARAAAPIDPSPSVDVPGSRGDLRVPERARVMSPHLPNYSGLSVDFSLTGVQLELSGPVEVGSIIPLVLALPGWKDDLSCQAEVVWCKQIPDNDACRAGCRFVAPEPQLYDALQEWIQSKLGRSLSFRSPRPEPTTAAPVEAAARALTPSSAASVEPLVEVPQPIQLPKPIKAQTSHHEEIAIEGTLRGYLVDHEKVRVQVMLPGKRELPIQLEGLLTFTDARGRLGEIVAYIASETTLEKNVLRFLSPALENILVLETHLNAPFPGALALASGGLAPARPPAQ
jgi:hypothetical protein